MDKNLYVKTINKVGIITVVFNLFLSLGKTIAGIVARSNSMISDGIHSASDVFSTIIVIIGAKWSRKEPDKEHPFGHERMESIASIILAVFLIITTFLLIYNGITGIVNYIKGIRESYHDVSLFVAMGFALISIFVKGWMYIYTLTNAKKINSPALKADAYHHLTDSLSSIGSLIGLIGLKCGNNLIILDPIASLFIALFILKIAIDIAKKGFDQMMDKAAPEEVQSKIKSIILNHSEVIRMNSLKTRIFGNMYYVETEIALKDDLTIKQGHDIAKSIHDKIENEIKDVKHCMIHVDPESIEKEK